MINKINEYIEDLLTVACCPGHDYSCKQVYEYVKQLQSNWNNLREWLEDNQDGFNIRVILNKMNELEGKNK